MNKILVIPTERPGVILRELTEADDAIYHQAIQESPEHVDSFGNCIASKYPSVEAVEQRRLRAGEDIRMGIWDGDEFEGGINARFEGGKTYAELGLWLRKKATGKGYATLAVKALTPYVAARVPRLFAEVHSDNIPSIAVMERAGYVRSNEVDREWGRAIVFEAPK